MVKNTNSVVKVEGHAEMTLPQRGIEDIQGLQDVPASVIPIPFYKLVQPGSTNVSVGKDKDAAPGTIYLGNSGGAVASLEFYLLRAKRQVDDVEREDGQIDRVVRIAVLGLLKTEHDFFIMSVPVSSFSNFGRMVKQLRDKKVTRAWEFPITATTEKVETTKLIRGRPQPVKYWIFNFKVGEERIDKKTAEALEKAYLERGASLDRSDEAVEQAEEIFGEPASNNGNGRGGASGIGGGQGGPGGGNGGGSGVV